MGEQLVEEEGVVVAPPLIIANCNGYAMMWSAACFTLGVAITWLVTKNKTVATSGDRGELASKSQAVEQLKML